MFSRRRFLQSSAVAASGSLVGCANIHTSPAGASARPGQLPRHIVRLVADAASSRTVTCADQLSHLVRGRRLTWLKLYDTPGAHSGLMDMRSLNSIVTDSSAASSSWGSGVRIINGVVNQA